MSKNINADLEREHATIQRSERGERGEREGAEGAWKTLITPSHLRAFHRMSLSSRQRLVGACVDLERSHATALSDGRRMKGDEPSLWCPLVGFGLSEGLEGRAQTTKEGEEGWWWRTWRGLVWVHLGAPPQHDEEPVWETLTPFEPLTRLIRSPEQAQLRRLLLTQRGELTFIDAPLGSGLSWGLAMAIADHLNAHESGALLISARPHALTPIIEALAPESGERLHTLTPHTLQHTLQAQLTSQRPLTPVINSPQHLLSALQGYAERSQITSLMNRWSHAPWLLTHLLSVWNTQEGEALRSELKKQEPTWCDDLQNLSQLFSPNKSLNNSQKNQQSYTELISPLKEVLQTLNALPMSVSCVVIDDALELPPQLLKTLLATLHQELNERHRGWVITLAGREAPRLGVAQQRWRDLKRLCVEELGQPVREHPLTQRERLGEQRASLLNHLINLDGRPWVEHPHRAITPPWSHRPLELNQRALVSCLPLRSALASLDIERLMKALLGTPGALLIDLSAKGELEREAPELWRGLGARACAYEALAELPFEPALCVVYAPQGLVCDPAHLSALPPAVARYAELLSLHTLRWLLSRSSGAVHLIGALSEQTLIQLKARSEVHVLSQLSELEALINAESPWGGGWVFEQREKARALMSAHSWAEALERWRALLPVATLVFDESALKEAQEALTSLHLSALGESLKARAWTHASALYAVGSGVGALTLSEPLHKALTEGFREALMSVRGAGSQGQHEALIAALKSLEGLEGLPPAEAYVQELARALRALSLSHLKRPVPQAPFQSALLRHLARLEPETSAYLTLLNAYQTRPAAPQLCELAAHVLSARPLEPSRELAWVRRHLLRWAFHLAPPLASLLTVPELEVEAPQSDEMHEREAQGEASFHDQLCLLYATLTARYGLWAPSGLLMSEVIARLPHLEECGEGEGVWGELMSAYREAREAQNIAQRRLELRARGALKPLEESFIDEPPPAHLSALFQLRQALEGARGLWATLTPAEREALEQAWERVQHGALNPRWGLNALSPLDEPTSKEV